MSKLNLRIFLLVLGMSSQAIYATDVEDAALGETQDCLLKQNCDSMKTPAGMAADQRALAAVGGDANKKQDLYAISADIMPTLMQMTGGDPVKMQALMAKAETDPEGFFNSLPKDIQARIKNTAKSVEKKQ